MLAAAILAMLMKQSPAQHASQIVTVDGNEYPVCYMEDGSDIIHDGQPSCVWFDPDTGQAWMTYAGYSLLITK